MIKNIVNYRTLWLLGLLLCVVLVLSSCAKKSAPPPEPEKLTLAQKRQMIIDCLNEKGVQVIRVGEAVKIVLLSNSIFNWQSANLTASAKPLLRMVALLMQTYQKESIQVAAYTDNQGKVKIQRALTSRQAEVVASYLWRKGIDARLVYAQGHNRLNPIDWNGSEKGRSNNRRVEISYRFYPRYVPYN